MGDKLLRSPAGGRLLLRIVQAAAQRMMSVVNLNDEVRHRQLQLMYPEPARGIARDEMQARTEKQQDIGGLPDQLPPGLQKRRRERRSRDIGTLEKSLERGHAAAALGRQQGNVNVPGAGLLERQAHVFAASLDAGPVVEAVQHGQSPSVAALLAFTAPAVAHEAALPADRTVAAPWPN